MISPVLFSGHMIDRLDRDQPRFPAKKEDSVRVEIQKILKTELKKNKNPLKGIAGGACGGDIIFHEVCLELNIPSEMYLASPPSEFIETSVSFAGNGWVKRFNRLMASIPHKVLQPAFKEESENVFQQANVWMLESAVQEADNNIIFITLWDGKGGDGKGGTAQMIDLAIRHKAEVKNININDL